MLCMSIPVDRIQLMSVFIRIVETGSISGAARELRVAQSSVSRQLRQLEDLLGTALLHRSTHKLSLTEAGRSFLGDSRRMVGDWTGIENRFRDQAVLPKGKLRVTASVGLGQLVLVDAAARYLRQHPEVELELHVDDTPPAILDSGIDCLIRIGRITEESIIAKIVAYVRGVLVASPLLIAERGRPKDPADLATWPMISILPFFSDHIPVRNARGKLAKAKGIVCMSTRNIVVARGVARGGAGFALLPQWLADEEIRQGHLEALLPGWEPQPMPVSIGTPPATHKQLKVKLFVEEVTRTLQTLPGLCRVTATGQPQINGWGAVGSGSVPD